MISDKAYLGQLGKIIKSSYNTDVKSEEVRVDHHLFCSDLLQF